MAFSIVDRATTFINDGWGTFNSLISGLLSTSNGKGASQVGIEDTAGNMTATNVEDALAEIYTDTATTITLAETFDENTGTTTGLTWGYKGGLFRLDAVVTNVAAGTVGLTDDATNYVEITPSSGAVTKNTTAFTSGRIPLRQITVASSVQTVSTDKRAWFSQVAAATTTTSGIVELATNAEAIAGTDTERCMTPANTNAATADVISNIGVISGLVLSNDTDTEHDILVSVGVCSDSSGVKLFNFSTALTKQIDATWVAGDDAGGLFDGTVANATLYRVFLIEKDSDGTIDAGFDTSATAANIPAGYTAYKRVGYVLTDGSANILNFTDTEIAGGSVRRTWNARILDRNAAAPTSLTPVTISVPPETIARIITSFTDSTSEQLVVQEITVSDVIPSGTNFTLAVTSAAGLTIIEMDIYVDASSQIAIRATANGTNTVQTLGYTDRRVQ